MTSLTLLVILGLTAVSSTGHGYRCPTALPQDVSEHSICHYLRKWSLAAQQKTYGIKTPSRTMPFARLDMGIKEFLKFVLGNAFLRSQAGKWMMQAEYNELVFHAYLNKTSGNLPLIMKMPEFSAISRFFHLTAKKLLDGFVDTPSHTEPFHWRMNKWISDEFFAEQRLAGVNPMTLKRVTFSDKRVNWNQLRLKLNGNFDWESTVSKVLNGKSLKLAIDKGYLYVLHHVLSDGLETMIDKVDHDPERKMWDYKSPITLFVSVPGKYWWSKAKLLPIAIQMDYKPGSQVYTPYDGDLWTLAKMNVQLTDLESSQIVEHLSKVHLVSEGLCISVERQLSKHHPLYAIMRYHCRGVFAANTLGGPTLLYPRQQLDLLFPYGYKGSNSLVVKISKIYEWGDLKLENNIKRRGVDDTRRLPYYPYRDDGAEIEKTIRFMMMEYVDTYYNTDYDVQADNEIQSYANEVSDAGTGPGGAQVQIRGFPPSIKSKQHLVDTFTQMVWLMTGQHASVNYPMVDYTMYIPNMPCKIYDSQRVPDTKLSPERLPNRVEAAAQALFAMTLSSYRYDRLFDYAEYLDDPKGRAVVFRYYSRLNKAVEPLLEKRNRRRLLQGHLTYPYMQPRWLTNGIQT